MQAIDHHHWNLDNAGNRRRSSRGTIGLRARSRFRWLALSLVVALLPTVGLTRSGVAEAAELGAWGPVLDWGIQAKHMAVLPTGNVLVWSTGLDARVWDSSTDAQFTPAPFASGDLHCAGQATLADGRIVVIGGQAVDTHEGIQVTALFDAQAGTWTNGAPMQWGRWYATATALADGRLLATSGDDINTDRVTIPEVYDPVTDTWTALPGADRRQGLYPYMFVAPGGIIFEAGPTTSSYYLDITNGGSWTSGPRNSFGSSGYAESAVQYLPGKILRAGGGDPAFANAAVIDLNVPNPQWRDIAPMNHARRRHDLTLLADGRVLAVGGTGRADSEQDAVLVPEIWDPVTELWTEVPAMAEARMYHSSTVLLPDGRIVVAGGETAGRKRAQVYEPSYLSSGPRPTMTSAPTAAAWGSSFSVTTPDAADIAKVALLRPSGGTHTFDHNQRYVPLTFTAGAGGLTVDAPVDGWTAPPGDYMLVIEDSSGVPSIAEWVRIGAAADLLPGEVGGMVTDAVTGLPIAGAAVTFGATSVTTEVDGSYLLTDLPAGERSVTASAAGYADQTLIASVTAAGLTTLDFALVAPGTVSGQVTTSTGAPIVGALVEIAGESVTTGPDGEYSVEIASGSHVARISAITYVAATPSVVVPPNATITLDVTLEDAPTILEGEVLDADTDEPIVGATVEFAGGSTTTDDNGFYKFVDVVPATYDVTASASGYVPVTDPVLVDQGLAATLDFGLSPVPPPITTLEAVADARVKSTSPTNNYGTESYLRTRRDAAGGTDYHSYLRFDVGGLAGQIQRATLRLFVDDGSPDGGSVTAVDWSGSEIAITWNNAPPLTGTPVGDLGQVVAGTWAEVDVTAAIGGTGTVSFGLANQSSNSAFFSSREGANPPQLVIETTPTALPVITTVSPLSGASGDPVSIFGHNLATVDTLSFDVTAAVIQSQTNTEITTVVPVGATSGPITVGGPDGVASSAVFTVLVPPDVTGFDPTSGPESTIVTITGVGLATASSVTFGGVPAAFSVVSDTVITATVPAGATDGPIAVTTQVDVATSVTSFDITNPPPVDSFTPTSGLVGETVTLVGSSFSTVDLVAFSGVATPFSIVSDTEITATVPSGAATGPITVSNPDGTATTAPFTVIVAPTITGFNPTSGVAGATQVDVTLTGTGFATVTGVGFNGTPGTGLSIDSDTQLRVEVPVGATTGPISVTNPAGTVDTGSTLFVVETPPPILTFEPTDDARIRPGSSKNYGSSDYLRTRTGDWQSYLRFEVAGLPNPPAISTLRLWVTDGSSTGIDVHAVDPGWSESTITGANEPPIGGPPIASTGPVPAGAWLEIDVTAAVSSEGPIAFALRGQGSNSVYISSKEGATPPQLVVATVPVIGPYISSFTPTTGPIGTVVDIYGSNLTSVTELQFGGGVIHEHQLTGGAIIDGTHIRVAIPAGSTTAPIFAVGHDGTFTTSEDFVVTTPPPPDTTPPSMIARTPDSGAVDVSTGSNVIVTFDEAVVGVDASSFTVTDGATGVPGIVTYDAASRMATFDPVDALAANNSYTVQLSSAITDVAATPNALAPLNWTFTTGNAASGGVFAFTASADTKVKSSSPNRNYGSEVTLRNRGGSPEWRTFVQFDVSGVTGVVVEAKLRLFVSDGSNAGGSFYATATGWSESSLTWSTAPALAGSSLQTLGPVAAGTWAEWDVTAAVSGNGTFSFGASSASTNSVFFDSLENPSGNVPQLVVTTTG